MEIHKKNSKTSDRLFIFEHKTRMTNNERTVEYEKVLFSTKVYRDLEPVDFIREISEKISQ